MAMRNVELNPVYAGVETTEELEQRIKLIYFNEKSSFRDKIEAEAKHEKMTPLEYFKSLLFQSAIEPRFKQAEENERKDNEAFAQRLVARGTFKTLRQAQLHLGLLDVTEEEAEQIRAGK